MKLFLFYLAIHRINASFNVFPSEEMCTNALKIENCTPDSDNPEDAPTSVDCGGKECVGTAQKTTHAINLHKTVGPIDLINEKMCICLMESGSKCSTTLDMDSRNEPCSNDICNGAPTDWASNHMTGCNCSETGYWGWYCDKPNTELCKHVDRGNWTEETELPNWILEEMNIADCGECRVHEDCKGFGDEIVCIHRLIDNKPHNFCGVAECPDDRCGGHGECLGLSSNGEEVCSCKPGWKGQDCTEASSSITSFLNPLAFLLFYA